MRPSCRMPPDLAAGVLEDAFEEAFDDTSEKRKGQSRMGY